MNKKFLVVALMAALSTVGYAAGDDFENLQHQVSGNSQALGELAQDVITNRNNITDLGAKLEGKVDQKDFENLQHQANGNSQALGELAQDVITNRDDIAANKDAIGNLQQEIENAAIGRGELSNQIADNKAEIDGIKDNVSKVEGEVAGIKGELAGKVNQEDFDKLQDQANGNSQALGELAQDVIGNRNNIAANKAEIEDLKENKADKNYVDEENKKQDATIAGKVDKSEFYDKYNELHMGQTFTDETLKTHREQIEALDKNKVDKNTYEEDKKAQAETDKKQDQALKDETTAREEADKVLGGRIDTLQQDFAKYDGRLSGLEKKVDNLDNKMNKGLSLMAAMNAVDFQNVQTGEMALGAGIGHYGNAQSVALGVAYSPVEDLTVNAKYSITAGDPDSFAVGAGATYKFKVGR